MITPLVIKELYKTYRRFPSCIDDLNLSLLFEQTAEHHEITIEDNRLIIHNMDVSSPFRKLLLNRIHGIENFEEEVAIVMQSSIIFLNKKDDGINVNVKTSRPSFWQRLKLLFRKR